MKSRDAAVHVRDTPELLPVVVFEFDVSAGLQHLPVLQPGELGLRLAPRLAGKDGGGAHRPSDRLRGLNELRRS